MPYDRIIAWLKRKQKRESALFFVLSILSLVAGLAVLLVTFWLAYAVLVIGMDGLSAASDLLLGRRLGLSHGWRLAVCFAFIVLLFIGQARANGEYPVEYPPRIYEGNLPKLRMLAAEISIFAHPVASAAILSYWLLMGPRLVFGSGKLLSRSVRLLKLLPERLGAVLGFMAAQTSSVSQEELLHAFPGLVWTEVVSDLGLIDGVLPLNPDLTRLTLSKSFREELRKLL